jgi:4-diphosphocytidyl-2-C-methyl-D-erythritol kinase
MGAELGSDVPYCVMGKTAFCEGRGELMTRIDTDLKLNAVIAIADERVSTPEAYSALDALYSNFDGSVKSEGDKYLARINTALAQGTLCEGSLYNIFEAAVLPTCSGASTLKKELLELGAISSMMSGSGPSVFGIFENKTDAENAAARLLEKGYRAYSAQTV